MALVLYELAGRDDELKFSPYCWRARLALMHKGLEWESRPWRFTEKDDIAFSGQGKVPVLCDGDKVVTDSFNIFRYLDRTCPDRPLLGDPMALGRARVVKGLGEQLVAPALMRLILPDLFQALHPMDRDYFRESREKRFGCSLEEFADEGLGRRQLHQALAPLQPALREQPFIDGETASGGDYLLFGFFMWSRVVSPKSWSAAEGPVEEWRERMLDLFDGHARNAPTVQRLHEGKHNN